MASPARTIAPVDWDLPNHELTRIWRTNYGRIQRLRKLAGSPAPRWDFRQRRTREDPEFRAAVTAEEARAAKG